ncbi:MAG: response regulator transcription factor [Actinobacteria bacterium]|nr:response regulator transcription factor [Actinomycetota bacterium]
MIGTRIAVACNDDEVLQAIRKELNRFYVELIMEPSRYGEAELAIIDLREDRKVERFLRMPFIAILSRATDFPPVRDAGAADYLLFPFLAGDLAFRVRLVYDRLHYEDVEPGFRIDLDNYEVIADGDPVNLTFKEFELLRFLIKSKGRVVPRTLLLSELWSRDYYDGNRTVDVHIRRIRAKLGNKYGDLVETVRSVGYRFRNGAGVFIEGGDAGSTVARERAEL